MRRARPLTNLIQYARSAETKLVEEYEMAHWTQDPKNKENLAKAAAKRARTRKKRDRRSVT